MLQGAVKGFVLLDRDYHSSQAIGETTAALTKAGLKCHIWRRHELENYLLVPEAVARLASIPIQDANQILTTVTDSLKDSVIEGMLETRFAERPDKKVTVTPISRLCRAEVNSVWGSLEARLELCPGKEVISGISRELQGKTGKTVSARALAASLAATEVPSEMADILTSIDRLAR
jgi:hypothetical protein